MNQNIFAFTALDETYPGFVSINKLPSGDVEVTVRAAPTVHENSIHICGFARQKGQPGICTPGDERCNNYCNKAPEKGPMQDRAAPCVRVTCGATVSFVVPTDQWPADWRAL